MHGGYCAAHKKRGGGGLRHGHNPREWESLDLVRYGHNPKKGVLDTGTSRKKGPGGVLETGTTREKGGLKNFSCKKTILARGS